MHKSDFFCVRVPVGYYMIVHLLNHMLVWGITDLFREEAQVYSVR